MRVAVRVVDVGAGSLFWSARFDRAGPLMIDTEQELAETICRSLVVQFTRKEG